MSVCKRRCLEAVEQSEQLSPCHARLTQQPSEHTMIESWRERMVRLLQLRALAQGFGRWSDVIHEIFHEQRASHGWGGERLNDVPRCTSWGRGQWLS